MTDLMKKAMAAVQSWPSSRQDEAAAMLLALDNFGSGDYDASPSELSAIDAAIADVRAERFASPDDVASVLNRFKE